VIAGSPRTFLFTAPTFEEYILKPNDYDIDSVYLIAAHGLTNDTMYGLVPRLESFAVAYLIHSSTVTETMQSYCKRKNRKYYQNLKSLD
jgi:hypothetical protein